MKVSVMKSIKRVLASVSVLALSAPAAMASTTTTGTTPDTTFASVNNLLDSWMTGTLGIIFGLGGIIYAGFQMFAGRYAAMFVGLALALLFSAGPAVVQNIFTGVI